MNEELFLEETNPKKVKYGILATVIIIILVVGGVVAYSRFISIRTKKAITFEVGTKISLKAKDYINNKRIKEDDLKLDIDAVEKDENNVLTKVGEYVFYIEYKGKTTKGKVIVQDTTAPTVKTEDLVIGVNEEYELDEFLSVCDDYSKPCTVTYKNESDESLSEKAGEYEVPLTVSDALDNKTSITAKLIVKEGYSREALRKGDLSIDHIDPEYDDFNKQLVLKYNEAISEDELDDDEKYNDLLELSADNLENYLPEEYKGSTINESEIIFVYNKYNYIVGFAFRVKINTGKYVYLTK